MIFSVETIYETYTSFKEQLLLITVLKKKESKKHNLKTHVDDS